MGFSDNQSVLSNEQAVSMGYKKNSSISDISDFTTTCYLYFQFIGSKKNMFNLLMLK